MSARQVLAVVALVGLVALIGGGLAADWHCHPHRATYRFPPGFWEVNEWACNEKH